MSGETGRNIREVFQWSILNHFFQFKNYKRLFESKFKFFGLIEPRLDQGLTRSRIFKKTTFKENRFFVVFPFGAQLVITPHEVPCNIFTVHKSSIYPKSNIPAMQPVTSRVWFIWNSLPWLFQVNNYKESQYFFWGRVQFSSVFYKVSSAIRSFYYRTILTFPIIFPIIIPGNSQDVLVLFILWVESSSVSPEVSSLSRSIHLRTILTFPWSFQEFSFSQEVVSTSLSIMPSKILLWMPRMADGRIAIIYMTLTFDM